VNTRCIYYHHRTLPADHKDNMTLAPFIDMINHSAAETVSISRIDNAMEVRAMRAIEKMEEIVFSYHSVSQRYWICEYGFWLETNNFDDLDVGQEIQEMVQSKREWLEKEGYWGYISHLSHAKEREYTISMEGEISFRVQVALRSILVSEAELREFMEGKNDGEDQKGAVDEILRRILSEKMVVCEQALALEKQDCIEADFTRRLWERELHISRIAQEQLDEVQV
jgi:SET domain